MEKKLGNYVRFVHKIKNRKAGFLFSRVPNQTLRVTTGSEHLLALVVSVSLEGCENEGNIILPRHDLGWLMEPAQMIAVGQSRIPC